MADDKKRVAQATFNIVPLQVFTSVLVAVGTEKGSLSFSL